MGMNRRQFLATTAALPGIGAWAGYGPAIRTEKTRSGSLKVTNIEVHELHIPFNPWRALHLRRFGETNRIFLYRVETNAGLVGYSDSYTDVRDKFPIYLGQSPFDFIRDRNDLALGIAMYDLMGKYLGVPVYELLGTKVRSHGKIGYFMCDLDAEGLAKEVSRSVGMGYQSIKIKGRPWFDPVEQVAAMSAASPADYTIEIDPNGHMGSSQQALPVLRRLERFPKLTGIEEPIRGFDLRGLAQLRRLVSLPFLLHWVGAPGLRPRQLKGGMEAVLSEAADGFVVGAKIGDMLDIGAVLEQFNLSCFIQTVGCGFKAAFALHLMAVLPAARLPAMIDQHLRGKRFVSRAHPSPQGTGCCARKTRSGCGIG